MNIPTIEERELQIARYVVELQTLRRDNKRLYNKLRRLENKIRNTVVVGVCVDMDELYRLRQMVPNIPRKGDVAKSKEK